MEQAKIKVSNLTKIFGPHPERALEMLRQGASKDQIMEKTKHGVGVVDADFEVAEGEILVVMGLSGSGKSTLIRMLNRLIEPTIGEVLVDGIDITKLSHKELLEVRRHKFGMVFQNFGLFPHRTVLANTEYGLEVQKVDQSIRAEKAREALKLVGLEGWEEARPAQLSGGMQQRVGLGPGPDRGPGYPVDGRSLQRAGPPHPPGHAARTHRSAGPGQKDHRLYHP